MLISGQRVIIKGKNEEVIVIGCRVGPATTIGELGHKPANGVPDRKKKISQDP